MRKHRVFSLAFRTTFPAAVDRNLRVHNTGFDPSGQPRRAPGASPAQRFPLTIPLDTPIKTSRKQAPPAFLGIKSATSFVRDCTSRDEWIDPSPKQVLLPADGPTPAGVPPRSTRSNCALKARRYMRWLQEELVNPANGNQYEGHLEAV